MEYELFPFFAGDPAAQALYEAFRDELFLRWPETQLKFSRTQLSFSAGVGFVFVSHPPHKLPGAILLSIGLRAPLDSPRVYAQSEPYPGRWTVHIPLHDRSEIDAELLSWVEAAHEYAVERSARRRRK